MLLFRILLLSLRGEHAERTVPLCVLQSTCITVATVPCFALSVVAALSYWDGMKPSVDYCLPKVLIITQNDQSHNRTATYVFICWSFMIQETIFCEFWRMLVFLTLLTRTYGTLVYFVMPLSLFHTGAWIGAGKLYLSMVQVWALPKSSFYLIT